MLIVHGTMHLWLSVRYWCVVALEVYGKGHIGSCWLGQVLVDLKKGKKNGKGIKWYKPTKLHAAFREWGLLKSTLALYLSQPNKSSVMK